jgi:hypothetical protein
MKRLLIPLAALLVCGMLTASAGALPLDSNHARSVAAERYYSSFGDPNAAAQPFEPAAPAAADDGFDGTPWLIAGGAVLLLAVAGLVAVRVRPLPARARVRTP